MTSCISILTHPFRDVANFYLDPLLAAKISGFIHDLESNLIDGTQTEDVQDRVLHLLYLEQHCGLKRSDMVASLGEILDEDGVSRVLSEEWDETWRSLIAHSQDRIRPYFRLHDRLLHNAVDISEGKRPLKWTLVRHRHRKSIEGELICLLSFIMALLRSKN